MKKQNKRGQVMGMPFQFIFSLILIAVALFVAFWAIRHFMSTAEAGKIGDFINNVKATIENTWTTSSEVEMNPTFDFSTKFGWVCFANVTKCNTDDWCKDFKNIADDKNFFLLGKNNETDIAESYGLSSAWLIEHLNITSNPICYPVIKGKVTMNLTKGREYNCPPPLVCAWPL